MNGFSDSDSLGKLREDINSNSESDPELDQDQEGNVESDDESSSGSSSSPYVRRERFHSNNIKAILIAAE